MWIFPLCVPLLDSASTHAKTQDWCVMMALSKFIFLQPTRMFGIQFWWLVRWLLLQLHTRCGPRIFYMNLAPISPCLPAWLPALHNENRSPHAGWLNLGPIRNPSCLHPFTSFYLFLHSRSQQETIHLRPLFDLWIIFPLDFFTFDLEDQDDPNHTSITPFLHICLCMNPIFHVCSLGNK